MKRILASIFSFTAACLVIFSAPALAAYNPLQGPCANNPSAICNENTAQQNPNSKNPVNNVLQTVSNIMALLTGLTAVGMIIGSGLVMTSSGGNPERVKKARAILQASIIGLIIVALAWSFVTFVVQNLIQ